MWWCPVVFVWGCILPLSYTSTPHNPFYSLTPINIGAQVHGVDLTSDPSPEMIQQIVKDTYKHKLLVFKGQKKISAERHLEISKWFGDGVDGNHRRHPAAEHPLVFRVSNDAAHGYTGVGNKGWHIDGFFFHQPHTFVLYYMPHVPQKGHTVFVDLCKVVEALPTHMKAKWERTHARARVRTSVVHPLIYTHPVTGNQTICINLDFVKEFILDYNTSVSAVLSEEQKNLMIEEIKQQFERHEYTYAHKWEEGDFLMTDNLALAHIADADTQLPPAAPVLSPPRAEMGLRVLHRVSIQGKTPPLKNPPSLLDNPLNKTIHLKNTSRPREKIQKENGVFGSEVTKDEL